MSDAKNLPESEGPRPTPPGVPFAALRERLGIPADVSIEPDEVTGDEYMRHSEFEGQRDAAGRTRYSEPSSCDGMLRIQDDSGTVWPMLCDKPGCRFEIGVHVGKVDPSRLLERRYETAGLPEQFIGKQFEGNEHNRHAREVCTAWLRAFNPNGLADAIPAVALWGGVGRGKTHLLSLMIETLIKRGVDAMYRSARELLDELQAGFDEQKYEARWQRALRVPVLALDDLGAGSWWTDWRRDRFEALVDFRFAHSLPLLIATNLPPQVWDETIGDRPASRLRGMTVRLRLEGPDRREHGQTSMLEDQAA